MRSAPGFAARHALGLTGVALALVVMWPLLGPGFTLVYDMVFVPSPHAGAGLLGLAGGYPRTVPTEAIVAALSWAAGGQAVQKAALLAIVVAGAVGAGRLVPSERRLPRVAAGVLFVWNPFTYERLLLGQWALLLGTAVVPWALGTAIRWRRGERGAGWRMVLWFAALTAASPYTGVIGGVTALLCATWPGGERAPADRPRRGAALVGAFVVVNLVWALPAVLHPAVPDRPRLAVELFRARSDSPLGTVGSLLSFGGLWRTDLAPPGRGTVAWLPAFVLIAGVAAFGWRTLRERTPTGWRRGLVAAAVIGLVLAAAPSLPGANAAMRSVAAHVPGAGFLRDSQKFVIPWLALAAVGFGCGVDRILERLPARRATAAGVVLAVMPLALAPTLAFGAWGRLHTTHYPRSWDVVQRVTAADAAPGAILVLPWHAYSPFPWNPGLAVHQPAALFFGRRVVAATALEVSGYRLPGEDPWSRLVDGPVADDRPLAPRLADLGIRDVVVFDGLGSGEARRSVAGLPPVRTFPDLRLYRVPGAVRIPRFAETPAGPVVAGDVLAVGLVVVATAVLIGGVLRRRNGARHDGSGSEPPVMLGPDHHPGSSRT
ncbi:MAG TPA: hypothetical protein VID47_14265 [Actinomycetota bacterium]